MPKIPDFNPIAYLLNRKFGSKEEYGEYTVEASAERLARKRPELARQIEEYRIQLEKMSPTEIATLLNEEAKKDAAIAAARAQNEENARFFNQPHARADFTHWSKAVHWTLDEAIALSLGKAPERVTWENIKPYRQISPFAVQYARRRDLALRAMAWKQMFDPVLPSIFLAWAHRNDFDVPKELIAAVEARGVQVADWKSFYEEVWQLAQNQDETIKQLRAELGELQERLASVPDANKMLSARERTSLLKLVIGMAVTGYGYDPTAQRSDQPSEIASDLALAGVPLDADTVRKWLKEGTELLGGPQTE
jgi:hypothetical protein